jgi:4-amino-4-deoxy-L-arabinose transferase-like glycosyltransferase
MLTAALVALAGRRLYQNRLVGWLAGLLTLCSTLILYVSHFIRPEIFLAGWVALALYIFALAEENNHFSKTFLLGLLLVLSFEIHLPNGAVFCFAFGSFYLIRTICARRWRFYQDQQLLGLIMGGLAGAIGFGLLRIAPDPVAFSKEAKYYFGLNYGENTQSLLGAFQTRTGVVLNHFRSWFSLSIIEPSLLWISLGYSMITWQKVSLRLSALLIFCVAGWMLLGTRDSTTYISVLFPCPRFWLPRFSPNSRRTRAAFMQSASCCWYPFSAFLFVKQSPPTRTRPIVTLKFV